MRIIIETECDNPYQIYDADLDIYYNYKEIIDLLPTQPDDHE